MSALILITAAMVGAIIASFLNVVISRGPRAWGLVEPEGKPKGLAFPPSQCESCGVHLKPWQLIPIVSYLQLNGQCANCGAKIGIRHFYVELLGVSAALLAVSTYGLSPEGIAAAVFLFFLIALACIDFEREFLPDALTLPLTALGVIAAAAGAGPSLMQSLIGGALGGGGLWLIATSYKAIRGNEGLGGGDVKLVAAAGAWLGPFALPFILLGASVSALLLLSAQVLLGQRASLEGTTELRFGPFLAAAMAAVMLLKPYAPL
ncbi:MAG: prepilin peptidase [Pseudomonadota bacterium]